MCILDTLHVLASGCDKAALVIGSLPYVQHGKLVACSLCPQQGVGECRMLAVDNGMGMEDQAGQARSSGGSDAAQGLQWGPAPAPAPTSPIKKKASSGARAAKEGQVGHWPFHAPLHCLL